jgi:bifunctional DNA-binding transcriptional regulator/antitoxin component of YhaV-PrlF toxin-antitoxin module
METDILVKVTAEGQLELPAEIQAKLSPGDEYMVSITEAEIVLKKSASH